MEGLNLFGVVAKGGWLSVPIILCSILMIAVVVERFLALRGARTNVHGLMMRIRAALSDQDVDRALRACEETQGSVAAMFSAGLSRAGEGRGATDEAMENVGTAQIFGLERHLGVLGTISGVAPLLGFLGTVTGMIKAFMKIQSLAGNVNAEVLAGGIWEAMVTTALGLSVGIPALIFYNYFVGRIQQIRFEMEASAANLLNILYGGKTDESAD